MKCNFSLMENNEYPTYRCSVCGIVVEVRPNGEAIQSILDKRPNCGEEIKRIEELFKQNTGTIQLQVGDFLHAAIVKQFGEYPRPQCKCADHIAKMNDWGIEKCKQKLNLIVRWLRVEAIRRNWWGKNAVKLSGRTKATRKAFNLIIRKFILDVLEKASQQELEIAKRLQDEQNQAKLLQTLPQIEKQIQAPTPKPLVDVVYAIGNGSRWHDNELRYSLRSLEKATDLGNVYIVGHKPDWVQNVIHIPHDDTHKNNKDANIIDKVRAAIKAGCSERFIFASDDQVLLKEVKLSDLPAYYSSDISGNKTFGAGGWWARMQSTRDYVVSKGKKARNFDTHVFQPHNATEFEKIAAESHYENGNGYCINTLVLNLSNVKIEHQSKAKATIDRKLTTNQIRLKCAGCIHLGYNDAGLTKELKAFLKEWFPNPSKYEIQVTRINIQNPIRGIVTLAGGDNYATNGYINCRMLRHMGCDLPIEWCYLGKEMSEEWKKYITDTIPNLTLIDLGGTNADNSKHRGGWQAKVESIINSSFDELLFIDADSFPLRNPEYLFESQQFKDSDLVLWSDIKSYDRRLRAIINEVWGVDVVGRQVESGQMLVRRNNAMQGLLKTREINQNSKEAYKYLYGDKDTFLIGAKQAGVSASMNPHIVRRCSYRNLKQHDFEGKPLFVHLTHGKWLPRQVAYIDENDYPLLPEAIKIHKELVRQELFGEAGSDMMHVRDKFCGDECGKIINRDTYNVRPMVGHRHKVRYAVDIGGNAGAFTYAVSASYPEAEIIVIEPDPELMEDIKYNTRDCKAKIHYIQAACVGQKQGDVYFVRQGRFRASSYIHGTQWAAKKTEEKDDTILTVSTVTLPDLLEQFNFQSIDILKIDAEGVEGAVLMSLYNTGWMPKTHWIRGEWHGRDDWGNISTAIQETHTYRLGKGANWGDMIAHNKMDE